MDNGIIAILDIYDKHKNDSPHVYTYICFSLYSQRLENLYKLDYFIISVCKYMYKILCQFKFPKRIIKSSSKYIHKCKYVYYATRNVIYKQTKT